MEDKIIEVEKQVLTIDVKARELSIESQNSYNMANEFLKTIKTLQTKIKDTFSPMKKKASDAHKEICLQETRQLELPLKAEALVKSKMLEWMQIQEEIRFKQEAKLQARAEKERQEALAKAEAARANGKESRAERYEEKAANIIAPQLAPTIDTGGAGIRKYWSAEVVDLMLLVKAIADGRASIMAVEPNMPFLNKQAEMLKETFNFPGIKAVSRDGLVSGRRG